MVRNRTSFAAFVPAATDGVSLARTEQRLCAPSSVLLQAQASVRSSGGWGLPGSRLVVSGALVLAGVHARVIFRKSKPGSSDANGEVEADAVVVPPGERVPIVDRFVRCARGGNPCVGVQLLDGSGARLTDEIGLGHCDQGVRHVEAVFAVPVKVGAWLAAKDCSNNRGPVVALHGEVTFLRGIHARFFFRGSDDNVGSSPPRDFAEVVVLPGGTVVQFPEQVVSGGVGGNNWVSFRFRGPAGTPIGEELAIGRCVRLS